MHLYSPQMVANDEKKKKTIRENILGLFTNIQIRYHTQWRLRIQER